MTCVNSLIGWVIKLDIIKLIIIIAILIMVEYRFNILRVRDSKFSVLEREVDIITAPIIPSSSWVIGAYAYITT